MTLVDRIYEAAFIPELWPGVLGEMAARTGAQSGALLVIDPRLPPLFSATANVVHTLAEFSKTPNWYDNAPAHRLRKLHYHGFLERAGFFEPSEMTPDNPYHANMQKIEADWQVGSVIDMPNGEMVLFTFERHKGLPDFEQSALATLDGYRPHLARSSLLAARLKLTQAKASVGAMEAIGIPAAIVSKMGRVLSTNALFETVANLLRPGAHGRVSIKDPHADALLQDALEDESIAGNPKVRSIPVRFIARDKSIVVHIIPLRRSTSDIFDYGAAMIAVTGYSIDSNVPTGTVLKGLFDLSAAEAGVASGLASGLTVAQIAIKRAVSVATVRTHLASVLRKTGTSQQGQLVALLKGVRGGL